MTGLAEYLLLPEVRPFAIAAMMRMIATTISSSIRENPFCFFIPGSSSPKNVWARETCSPLVHLPLYHVNFCAVFVEFNFIHQLIDEIYPAAMIGIDIFTL